MWQQDLKETEHFPECLYTHCWLATQLKICQILCVGLLLIPPSRGSYPQRPHSCIFHHCCFAAVWREKEMKRQGRRNIWAWKSLPYLLKQMNQCSLRRRIGLCNTNRKALFIPQRPIHSFLPERQIGGIRPARTLRLFARASGRTLKVIHQNLSRSLGGAAVSMLPRWISCVIPCFPMQGESCYLVVNMNLRHAASQSWTVWSTSCMEMSSQVWPHMAAIRIVQTSTRRSSRAPCSRVAAVYPL